MINNVHGLEIGILMELEQSLDPALTAYPIAQAGLQGRVRSVEPDKDIRFRRAVERLCDESLIQIQTVERYKRADHLDERLVEQHDVVRLRCLPPSVR